MENRFSRNPHNRHQENGYRCVLGFCLFTSINQINEVFVTSDQIFFSLQHKFQETFILRIFISNLMNDYFITFTYCLQNI